MLRVKPIIYLFPILLCCAIPAEAAGKSERLDSTALPLGDGKISAEPMRGHVYSCQSHFRGGVAHRDGDWLGSDSWDTTHKIHVQGDVRWPNASISVSPSDGVRRIVGNGLPTGHGTGIFPVRESDPAYQIDRNPNRIEPQQIVLNLPLQPELAEQAASVSTTSLESAVQRLSEQAPPKLFELIEETVIRTAFEFCEENQVQTARLLDISRNVLRHKLALYGMLPSAQKTLVPASMQAKLALRI